MTHWGKPQPRVIAGGKADRALHADASQPRIVWNFWPLAAVLLNTLLWVGICWVIYAFS